MSNDPWPTTKHTYTARASMKPDNVTQETWDSLCSMTDPDPDPHAARGDLASRIDAQLPKRLTPEADLYVDAADGGPPATPDRAASEFEVASLQRGRVATWIKLKFAEPTMDNEFYRRVWGNEYDRVVQQLWTDAVHSGLLWRLFNGEEPDE